LSRIEALAFADTALTLLIILALSGIDHGSVTFSPLSASLCFVGDFIVDGWSAIANSD
jgi:hypothetical protein